MYLKEIEIHGFKSFANDTILKFEKGITAIVGPNGSGKSNIADAVRWVLGEQKTKQQRVTSMLDVIFSGTEHKKAQGFAYVRLVIDNTDRKINIDYDELQVSRRLYRSGDSEYKLNGEECRLKDINEIFYDTGIGKEGYSIIGQGQIDKILSNKPEDRRELFDEAVGIVKYKKRKSVAEKKLEEEQLNISRVTDIMGELARQVEPLRKQSVAAKEYVNLKEDLFLYESNHFVRIIDKQNQIIKDSNEKLVEVENDLKEAKIKKDEFTNKFNEIDINISNIDVLVANLRDELSNKSALKENLFGQINVIKEQINSEKQTNDGRQNRIETIDNLIKNSLNDISKNLVALNDIKKQIMLILDNNVSIDVDDANVNDDIKLIDDTLKNTQQTLNELLSDNYQLDFDENNNELFKNDNILSNFNSKQKSIEEVDIKINNKTDELKNNNIKLKNKSNELDEISNDILKTQNLFHSEESKLDTIKNMLERYEGYSTTVKNIMDEKEKFDGIKGVVADIIKTNKEYEVAIEIALGNTIQNIVVDNEFVAKNVIEYLKTNKYGRATFLPLNVLNVKNNNIYLEAKNEEGAIDIASNLTEYDKEFEILANYLLSNCLIVDNFDNANRINKKYNYKLKIVTLQGELFSKGGSISGGVYKNSLSLLGRNRQYEDAKIKVDELKNQIDKLEVNKKRITEEYEDIYNNINNLKEEINNLSIEKNTLTLNIINDIKLEYTHISEQAKWICVEVNRIVSEIDKNYKEKNDLDNKNVDSANIINEKQDEITNINNELNNVSTEIENIANDINTNNEEKNKLLSNRQEYYALKDKLSNNLISLEQDSFKLKSIIEKSSQAISDISEKNYEEYQMTYDLAKEKYDENLGDLEQLKKNVSEVKKKISSLGPININAIEEYKELSSRYETTITQYDDLKKSEEMILKIVKELDENMKIQFNANFKFIKAEFDRVFKELFGGGKATLTLIESESKDPLEAGVGIVVQPPGKKLGNLSQLSGGERALTAIALMFAIQNLKPSPFCLLDEIEAALDESNVDRFAEYLKNLVDETQFILITHRRGTMENADRLYGITMQEKGITSLVSVNLVEDTLI